MDDPLEAVAIVGAACRFSGGVRSPSDLWDMLVNVRSGHCRVPESRWNTDTWYHPDPDRKGGIAVNHGYFLEDDVSKFDAPFFSVTAREANAMDPMKRHLLEVCYEGVENAGMPFERLMGTSTGCYVGCMNNDYEMLSLHDIHNVGHAAASGLSEAMSANRVSWFFGLTGPSMTIDTACSSSLYALHLACQSIQSGETNQALVAGINLMLAPITTHQLSAMHMLSPEGISHTFDSRANGYGRGEGIGCLVVKRLRDALRDGDTIRAVIRGTGVNADGKTPSVTQPSSLAQADLIRSTYAKAGLDMSSTQYFECHGTGTPVGDPIELQAVASTLGKSITSAGMGPLFIGSLKPNIGHTEGCSGLAGILKAVLCLEHGVLVPTFGVDTINSKLKLSDWNLALPEKVMAWPTSGQRRISVNSFGFGGANATAILDDAFHYLEERGLHGNHNTLQRGRFSSLMSGSGLGKESGCPFIHPVEGRSGNRLLVLSGKDQGAIDRLAAAYTDRFSRRSEGTLSVDELAWTLASRRSHLDYRSFLLAPTVDSLRTQLTKSLPKSKRVNSHSANLVFVCTGQGAQWPTMGLQLLHHAAFAASLSRSQRYLELLGCQWDIIPELHKSDTSKVHLPEYSQTLCTVLQVALVDLLRHWSVLPRATIGHSSGEIAAAYAARLLSHMDAVKIAYMRGTCSSSIRKAGAMLAVGLPAAEASQFLTHVAKDTAVVACINSPSSVTLSGDVDAIDALETVISASGAFARKLKVQIAYHSPHMLEAADTYLDRLGRIEPLSRCQETGPEVVMFSSLTGLQVVPSELNEEYWMSNMCAPVQFAAAFESLLAHKSAAIPGGKRLSPTKWGGFIEIGPHAALQGPFQQIIAETSNKPPTESPYLSMLLRNRDASVTALTVAGQLWSLGYSISLPKVNGFDGTLPLPKSLVDLPPYRWNYTRSYWYESVGGTSNRWPKGPRSDLLGQREEKFSTAEPRWRNILRASENPWIEDHKITGTVLYPAAGMLVMALEGAKEMANAERSLDGFRFHHVEFKRGLVIPVGDESTVEVRLTLYPDDWSPGRFRFRISSAVLGSWTEHCGGVVELEYAIAADRGIETSEILDIEWQDQTTVYRNLLADTEVARKIDVKEFYDHLESIGTEYGPLFRNVVQLTNLTKRLAAHGSIQVPDTISSMPARYEYPHTIHPATLDSLFHILLAAPNDGQSAEESVVPYRIEEMFISAQQPKSAVDNYKGFGVVTNKSVNGHEVTGDLIISDEDWAAPKVVINNFSLRRVTGTADPHKVIEHTQKRICAQLRWRKDIDFISASSLKLPAEPIQAILEWLSLAAHKIKVESVLIVVDLNPESDENSAELLCNLAGQIGGIENVTKLVIDSSHDDDQTTHHFWDTKAVDPPECLSSFQDIVLVLDGSAVLRDTKKLNALRGALSPEGLLAYATLSTSDQSSKAWQQGLFKAGFSNIVFPLRKMDEVALSTSVPSVTSAKVSSEVVVLVSDGPTSLRSLSLAIQQKLEQHGIKAEILTLTTTSAGQMSGRFVISLLEAEQSFIDTWSEQEFDSFKRMILSVKHMLWITRGSILEDWAGSVEFAAAQGLLRVLRNEIPHVALPLLDLSVASSLDHHLTSRIIVDVFLASLLPRSETEFAELNGDIFIPRAIPAPYLDEALPHPHTRIEDLGNLNGTLALQQTSGNTSSLWIPVDHNQATERLTDNKIQVDVEVLNLGRTPSSNVVVGTVTKCGAMVTKIIPGQRVACFGIEGCQTSIQQDKSMVFAVPNTGLESSTVALCGSLMMAQHAFVDVAKVEAGQTILVVDAECTLGQASARIAKALGAQVFALVDSADTKDLLASGLGIPSEQIFDGARRTFVPAVRRATKGRGVDIVVGDGNVPVNNLAATILGEFGCFLDIATSRTSDMTTMPPIRPSCTLVHVDSESLFRVKGGQTHETFERTLELISSDLQQDQDCTVRHAKFSVSNIEQALALKDSQAEREVLVSFAKDSKVLTLAPPAPKFRLDPDGIYVLSGGLGALGLKVADMMMEQGARHIAFLSRSGGSKNRNDLEKLHAKGVKADAFKCDINDRESTASVFKSLISSGRPIKGVIQAAMVLEDSIFENLTYEQWTRAYGPKAVGSRNLLDQLSLIDKPFFILLSSITGIIGNAGQANYASGNTCEDALASYARTHLGLPATSIDVGLVLDTSHFLGGHSHGFQGVQTTVEELQAAILAIMGGAGPVDEPIPGQVIVGLDNRIVRQSGATRFQRDPKFNLMTVGQLINSDAETVGIQEQLRTAGSADEAATVVQLKIKQYVASAVGIDVDEVDVEKPLFDFGVDSLQAVELRSQIAADLRSDVSVFELLSPSPIAELARTIASRSELVEYVDEDLNT